jgi:flagellar biosynthesis protein FlhF
MQVKRYEAVNIHDALAKIKSDMGPDAIVLSTKRLPGEKRLIEVLAAKDNGCEEQEIFTGESRKSLDRTVFSAEDRDIIFSLRSDIEEMKMLLRGAEREKHCEEFVELKDYLDTFFDALGEGSKGGDKSTLSKIYYYLVTRGISKARACHLLEKIKQSYPSRAVNDYEKGLEIAEDLLKETFIEVSKQERRVKVFLGPTGVGKTTTLAKLAARYSLEQKKSVGLITTDTYRIAAVEQLKTYARIMGLPLEVVTGRETFRQSMERLHDKECILVDTPGRGREETGHLSDLKDMLVGDWDMEKNLLLSLTSSRENLMDVVGRFSTFGYDKIILTKLDECTHCGILCDVIERASKPVSYISTGQNVPQDIEQTNPGRLAELIMRH